MYTCIGATKVSLIFSALVIDSIQLTRVNQSINQSICSKKQQRNEC